ncbi:MAG TPA: DNA polymerase IV [Patescibacteria group bacterium]
MAAPIILHIDFDSFFASVEQQDNPKLRNKPIAVTATNGRTAIIAASREAKALGIPNVTRTFEAIQICPYLTIVPAHFVRYLEVSKQFLKICNQFSPTVELFSIDEVFMDVTQTVRLFGSVASLIKLFKYKVATEIGPFITVSIGVSHNKLLAKLASGLKKPNGTFAITPQNLDEVYKSVELTDICGIGEKIKRRLNKLGIYSLLALRSAPIEILQQEFGIIESRFLKQVGLGVDLEPVIPYTKAPGVKSVGRNYALPRNEYNKRIVYQNVFELCEEVAIKLRRLRKKAQAVGLGIRGDSSYYSTKKVSQYLDSGLDLFTVCKQFLDKWNPTMVRMISVWSGSLIDSNNTPQFLFENTERKTSLQKTIDRLNDKFGDHTIRNGFLLYADKLTTVPNGFGADRWERKQLSEFT